MQKQFLWVAIIVIVLGGGYWWWQSQNTGVEEMTESDSEITDDSGSVQDAIKGGAVMEDGVLEDAGAGTSSDAPLAATVTYNGSSFSPAKVTIKKGGAVTWTNIGDTSMWVASAQHPTHTVYAGTSLQEHCAAGVNNAFDQCAGGDSYSFIFDKVGTWNYHDHLHASIYGSVVVE